MALPIPRFSYDDLRARANSLLQTHNPAGHIPIPIEEIVEFGFGINIIPIPGLLTVHEVDAFTAKDLRSIMVDLSTVESRSPNRYRFSLAHELGHVVLHADVYAQIEFLSIREWKQVVMSLPEKDREWLEWQAYSFAGLILVPREPLMERLADAVRIASEQGFDVVENHEPAKDYVCTWLGRQFEVSSQVVEKRLDKDGLWPPHI